MLKVMIVDDELIVRVGFQSSIHWEDYGCQVTATCESAKEAIACFGKEVPDIVFTDIMMPEMNGIELVKYIRENYPRVRVVVLSCINEIEYVKSAIRLGAEDYILKLSFTKETMTEIILKLKSSIEEERKQQGESNLLTEIHTFNREDGLRMLLAGNQTAENSGALLDQLGYLYNPHEVYAVGCLMVDQSRAVCPVNDADTDVTRYGLLNLIREYFVKYREFDLAFFNEKEILVIFRREARGGQIPALEEVLEPLNHAIRTHLNLTVSMGVVNRLCTRMELSDCYGQARQLAGLRFFDGFATFHTEESGEREAFRAGRSVQKKIREAVYRQSEGEVFTLVEEWFAGMRKARRYEQIMQIRRAVVETWIFVSGYTLSNAAEPPEYDDMYSCGRFWEAETLEDLKRRFLEAVRMILTYLSENRAANSEILKFLNYLEHHVEEAVSLEQAAGQCALGKSQFCILFKKQTGETFVNYFNRLKMERAFLLLSGGNIQVQEAANRVGIREISYFSRLFKKYYDISPSDVKKR